MFQQLKIIKNKTLPSLKKIEKVLEKYKIASLKKIENVLLTYTKRHL